MSSCYQSEFYKFQLMFWDLLASAFILGSLIAPCWGLQVLVLDWMFAKSCSCPEVYKHLVLFWSFPVSALVYKFQPLSWGLQALTLLMFSGPCSCPDVYKLEFILYLPASWGLQDPDPFLRSTSSCTKPNPNPRFLSTLITHSGISVLVSTSSWSIPEMYKPLIRYYILRCIASYFCPDVYKLLLQAAFSVLVVIGLFTGCQGIEDCEGALRHYVLYCNKLL